MKKDWDGLLAELERRRAASLAMGGNERVERLITARGKLDARRRLELLFDADSFLEFGGLAGGESLPADALVCGLGRVEGRKVLAGAEDFSVAGGSIGAASMAKRYRVAELARQEGVPLVFILDGAGHRLTENSGGRVPNDLLALADMSGEVPMVCLVLGSSAGHGALTAPLSDFTVMSATSAIFTAGPPLVASATGEVVSKEELGGPQVAVEAAGVAHNVVEDDASAIAMARRYLSYFPSNATLPSPRRSDAHTAPRTLDAILDIIPVNDRRGYDMHRVLEILVDKDSFLEIQPGYGASLITGLAFLGGHATAILANNPLVHAGAIDVEAAIKGEEFITNAGAFGLPFVFLADNPGLMAGTASERAGILKWGGRMFRAQRALRAPKVHVTLRKAFGFGTTIMGQNPFDKQTACFALPTATLGAMPAASGGRSAGLDDETQAEVEARQASGPWAIAERFGYDDILDPRELRDRVIAVLDLAADRPRGI
jgi:acetyl-CoA carboxylase carboxyltransferase component